MSSNHERNLEEVNEILSLAKKNEDDIIPTSQTIYFAEENLHDNDYKFLELDKHLLETLQEGQSLFIKGLDSDDVVLCTDSRTYDVTCAETSNSLLLTKNLRFFEEIKNDPERKLINSTVCGIFYEYLAVTQTKPHLKRLFEILEKTVYKGSELEYRIKPEDLVTFEDLKDTVQASDKELDEALKSLNLVKIDNNLRLLDFDYHFRVLSQMLKLIDENSWPLDEIDYEVTLNTLEDLFHRDILCSLFEKYTEDTKTIDALPLYRYKEEEICRFTAQSLLYRTGKFNLDEFLQVWKESVPEGMTIKEEYLYGIAVIDRRSIPITISAFPEDDLPEDIHERFATLFKVKEKWTVPEIAPYIQKLATEKLDVNAILAKYARASKVDGVTHYSAKHSK